METRTDLGTFPDFEHVRSEQARVLAYRHGCRVFFKAADTDPPRGLRDVIKDQSRASRHRAAFAFGNAECDWLAMSVLTWREIPTAAAVKSALARLQRKWRERWGECMDAWLMEMQARGCPHFHIFHAAQSSVGASILAGKKEVIVRRGWETILSRGGFEYWLIQTWLDCIGDRSPQTIAFNRGGIVELMRSPDAAGRYVAKECSKREQKVLPERYQDGLGRWWHLAKRWEPRVRAVGELEMREWPWTQPVSRVWDAEALLCAAGLNMEAVAHNAPNTRTWESFIRFANEPART